MGYLQLAQNNAPECYAGSTICPKTATKVVSFNFHVDAANDCKGHNVRSVPSNLSMI
jgi:hypothetical protein